MHQSSSKFRENDKGVNFHAVKVLTSIDIPRFCIVVKIKKLIRVWGHLMNFASW